MFWADIAVGHRIIGVPRQSFALHLKDRDRGHVLITCSIQGTLWILFHLTLATTLWLGSLTSILQIKIPEVQGGYVSSPKPQSERLEIETQYSDICHDPRLIPKESLLPLLRIMRAPPSLGSCGKKGIMLTGSLAWCPGHSHHLVYGTSRDRGSFPTFSGPSEKAWEWASLFCPCWSPLKVTSPPPKGEFLKGHGGRNWAR